MAAHDIAGYNLLHGEKQIEVHVSANTLKNQRREEWNTPLLDLQDEQLPIDFSARCEKRRVASDAICYLYF
jgi:hypothetical protein